MIAFSSGEIAFSLICSLIYGCLLAVIISALSLVIDLIKSMPYIACEIAAFDRITPLPRFVELRFNRERGALFSFFTVIIYSLGFVLLSYLCLDGVIRFYMIVLSSASFYISKITFCKLFGDFLFFVLKRILSGFSLILRLPILLLRRLILSIKKTVKRPK